MKRFVLAIAVTLPLICSAEQTAPKKKTTAASAKAATGKKAAPPVAAKQLTIPADAVQIGENTYSKTDEQGKKWIYYQTPFGITRAEEPTAAQKQAAAMLPAVPDYSAAEEGTWPRPQLPGSARMLRVRKTSSTWCAVSLTRT